ncbi:MAG: hypothetical protein ABIH03_15500 [Pseudomonadota bacterium]
MTSPRKVLLGTPCFDGRPEAWYMDSVLQTIELCARRGIVVKPILMSYDAMIQRARNDLLKLALASGFDDILYIDADEVWQPQWAVALIEHDVDVVGAAVRKKTDNAELYNVRARSPFMPVDAKTGLWIVDGIGTGFVRLSRKAMQALWDSSEADEYVDNGKINRMVFNVAVVNRVLVSEDNFMCNRLAAAGFNIYIDPSFTVSHIGPKRYTGDFAAFIARLQRNSKAQGVAA